MSVIIKTKEELVLLREAGKRLADVVARVAAHVVPGITTYDLDQYARQYIREYGDTPAFLNYQPEGADYPFPAAACISVNEEVVHGIPSIDMILEEGDVVSVDIGLCHKGVFTDHAVTVPVGKVSSRSRALLDATHEALLVGCEAIVPGARTGDIGYAIEKYVAGKYGIVRELAGHGVGREIHEDPYVPNYGKKGTGEYLVPGMVIAIEPMLTLGTHEVFLLDDGYTFITADKKYAAHFEHTVEITEEGYKILTLTN